MLMHSCCNIYLCDVWNFVKCFEFHFIWKNEFEKLFWKKKWNFPFPLFSLGSAIRPNSSPAPFPSLPRPRPNRPFSPFPLSLTDKRGPLVSSFPLLPNRSSLSLSLGSVEPQAPRPRFFPLSPRVSAWWRERPRRTRAILPVYFAFPSLSLSGLEAPSAAEIAAVVENSFGRASSPVIPLPNSVLVVRSCQPSPPHFSHFGSFSNRRRCA